jgi:hypothetical protein
MQVKACQIVQSETEWPWLAGLLRNMAGRGQLRESGSKLQSV